MLEAVQHMEYPLWLVVWNIFFSFHIWDNPSHRLIFFKMVKNHQPALVNIQKAMENQHL